MEPQNTPPEWTRNARGFDEPPNNSPKAKSVLLFLGGIVALIALIFAIISLVG
jgi:hypothetical protein